jgi:hypothetical protein
MREIEFDLRFANTSSKLHTNLRYAVCPFINFEVSIYEEIFSTASQNAFFKLWIAFYEYFASPFDIVKRHIYSMYFFMISRVYVMHRASFFIQSRGVRSLVTS